VPWPRGLKLVQDAIDTLQAGGTTPSVLDCTIAQQVISAAEITYLRTAVAAYNAHISTEAAARGWAYFDINPALQAERQSAANPTGRIPAFPDALPAFNDPPGSVTFGALFTLDGVHPSSLAHRLVADSVARAINANYGTTLPVPICSVSGGPVSCPRIEGDP
jgi:lysophospholipase L1-like esterase